MGSVLYGDDARSAALVGIPEDRLMMSDETILLILAGFVALMFAALAIEILTEQWKDEE